MSADLMAPDAGNYASPIDAAAFGEYRRVVAGPAARGQRRFDGRVTTDGSSPFAAAPGRYHLYAGWASPWAQRATIQIAFNGLADVVSVSYVDGLRDGRGWAFRPRTGPDPVNGFTLLRQAYTASAPDYAGPVSVPVLWDRRTHQIVSNDPATIDVDLATRFGDWAATGIDTYPLARRAEIDATDERFGRAVAQRLGRAVYDRDAAEELLAILRTLDGLLSTRRYLVGDQLTLADVRLWVSLVRYDVGANAHGAIGARVSSFTNLWAYARDLYSQPAFASTTDFAAFAAPFAARPDWTAPARRPDLRGYPIAS